MLARGGRGHAHASGRAQRRGVHRPDGALGPDYVGGEDVLGRADLVEGRQPAEALRVSYGTPHGGCCGRIAEHSVPQALNARSRLQLSRDGPDDPDGLLLGVLPGGAAGVVRVGQGDCVALDEVEDARLEVRIEDLGSAMKLPRGRES